MWYTFPAYPLRVRASLPPTGAFTRINRPPVPERGMNPSLRILVCDDNVDVARALAPVAGDEGHVVHVVHTGPAAGDGARQVHALDAVFLDLNLASAMDGVETARRLRRDLGLADVLLVAVTGAAADDDLRRTSEAGFDLHLVKPVEAQALRAVLARAIRRP